MITSLHSSRMRTACALTVSPSMLCAGGVAWSGGVPGPRGGAWSQGDAWSWGAWSRGVPGPRGCLVLGGVPGPGVCVLSQHALRQTPLLTESHMPVKTLPCPNFIAGGN